MADKPKKKREFIDFKELKARVSMEDLLGHYDLAGQMERKDEETLIGPCPLTGSSSDTAFKVNTEKDIWYSFVLEDGGNILDFVAKMEDTDVVGAANLIDGWFERGEESSEDAEPDQANEPHDDTRGAFYQSVDGLCRDELAIIHETATREIQKALSADSEMDNAEIEGTAAHLADWILRAYQAGYEHGKMTGAIEGRVNRLLDR